MRITIRDGWPDDLPAILGMLDSRVEWLVSQGRTGQWGTKPLSQSPKTVESIGRYMAEGSRAGVSLLRVDCYAGDDGKLVRYYESNGFTRTEAFTVGESQWPGQLLARRV
ncbi:hypothetical protein ACFZDI_26285 [Streptomyces sp. NPDC007907]|uniref:hypothetical protein n=1 Tax=Streptomyces sp. NPDC007907 TaxID=3364789 RepID=UPI0036EF6D6F